MDIQLARTTRIVSFNIKNVLWTLRTGDFSGGDALYGVRVAQIRWQDSMGKNVLWAIGVLDPKTSMGKPDGADRRKPPTWRRAEKRENIPAQRLTVWLDR